MNHPRFYSVVRFRPSSDRGEAVIVGAPPLGLRVHMTEQNERRFGTDGINKTRLTLTKDGFAERMRAVESTDEARAAFGASESGTLQPVPPRPMVIDDLDHNTAQRKKNWRERR